MHNCPIYIKILEGGNNNSTSADILLDNSSSHWFSLCLILTAEFKKSPNTGIVERSRFFSNIFGDTTSNTHFLGLLWVIVPHGSETLLCIVHSFVSVGVGAGYVMSSEQLQNVLFVFEQFQRCLKVFVIGFREQDSSNLSGLGPKGLRLFLRYQYQSDLLNSILRNAIDELKLSHQS